MQGQYACMCCRCSFSRCMALQCHAIGRQGLYLMLHCVSYFLLRPLTCQRPHHPPRAPATNPDVCLHPQLYGFSSAKKMASVLMRLDDRYRLYNKGAAEWVLKRSIKCHIEVRGGAIAAAWQEQEPVLRLARRLVYGWTSMAPVAGAGTSDMPHTRPSSSMPVGA